MGDYARKPSKYRRQYSSGGNGAAAEKMCEKKQFACAMDIMVFAGLEPPCTTCATHIQEMRDLLDWERHPAKHGTFYTSKNITLGQQRLIDERIETLREIPVIPTDQMIEAAAEAIANARGMRRGIPSIAGILAALPSKIHDDVMEDAKAALEAAELVRPK